MLNIRFSPSKCDHLPDCLQMITLYRDPEGEHVLSNKEGTQYPVASISNVNTLSMSLRSGSCIGCQQLQTKVKDLEESFAVVGAYMYSNYINY